MNFSSPIFVFYFLPTFLLFMIVAPIKARYILLMIFNLLFYTWGVPVVIPSVLLMILLIYLITILIDKAQREGNGQLSKVAYIVGILLIIIFLICFKYPSYIIRYIYDIFPSITKSYSIPSHVPIGISFFVLHSISYLADVYYKTSKKAKTVFSLGAYLIFFPHVVSGPISLYRNFDISKMSRPIPIYKYVEGIELFIVGLGYKVLLANHLGYLSNDIYLARNSVVAFGAIVASTILFGLQLYFDFAGYSKMAIGLGKICGLELPRNFNLPYISTSVTEFWQRWHITLGAWLREYVYIPLGGSHVPKSRNIINILLVFLVSGIWHGTGMQFVLWGIWHGLWVAIENIFERSFIKVNILLKWLYTQLAVFIGWMIFRSSNISSAFEDLRSVIYGKGVGYTWDFLSGYANVKNVLVIIVAVMLALGYHLKLILLLKKLKFRKWIYEDFMLFIVSIITLIYVASSSYIPFIYGKF